MAGQTGAFSSALDDIRSAGSSQKKPAGKKRAPAEPASPDPGTQQPESEPAQRRKLQGRRKSRTEPFNHRVDGDVKTLLYDLALDNDWTMNRTLREAARALATRLGDKDGGGV